MVHILQEDPYHIYFLLANTFTQITTSNIFFFIGTGGDSSNNHKATYYIYKMHGHTYSQTQRLRHKQG